MPRAGTAAARTSPRPQAPPARPSRRRSGPARATAAARAAAAAAPRTGVLALPRRIELPRIAAAGLLDRLLRGRVWVALIGTLLVGIVFFNVSVMRLNQTITRANARATQLKRDNGRLLFQVARASSSERIQRIAAARGFVLPVPADVRYLQAKERLDPIRAAHRIVPPQPTIAPLPTPQSEQTAGALAPPSPVRPTATTPTTTGTTGPSGATGTSGASAPTSTTPTTTTPATTTTPSSPTTTATGGAGPGVP